MTDHYGTMRVAKNDLSSHIYQSVDEEQSALKHLLMEKHGTLGLRGHHNQDAQQVGGKPRPRRVTDGHE